MDEIRKRELYVQRSTTGRSVFCDVYETKFWTCLVCGRSGGDIDNFPHEVSEAVCRLVEVMDEGSRCRVCHAFGASPTQIIHRKSQELCGRLFGAFPEEFWEWDGVHHLGNMLNAFFGRRGI